MKLLITGDLHLRLRTPERRTEADFKEVCLGKLAQVLDLAREHKVTHVLQPGDFFNSPNPSGELVAETIELIRGKLASPGTFLAIHGQHDLAYHSETGRRRSGLRILKAAECLTLLGNLPYLSIYGADWGQEVPEPHEDGDLKILVAHTMVGNKPLWPGHELTAPEAYVRKHPGYDLYVLGDYHYPFIAEVGDALVVNAGCLIRQQASERELAHKPQVVVYDSEQYTAKSGCWFDSETPTKLIDDYRPQMDSGLFRGIRSGSEEEDEEICGFDEFIKGGLTPIPLQVAPAAEAFDLSGMEQAEEQQFDAFTAKLREQGKIGVDFESNLQAYFEAHETAEPVRQETWAAVEGAKG